MKNNSIVRRLLGEGLNSNLNGTGFQWLFVLAFGLMLVACTAQAVDKFWTNNAAASYNNATYWTPNGVPNGDNAINNNGSANVVQVNSGDPNWVVNDILVGTVAGTSGAFYQDGPTVTLNAWFRLADNATASGSYTLQSGTLNIAGNDMRVNIGEEGTGVFNLNGGTLSVAVANTETYVGSRGDYGASSSGTVNHNGGTFTSAGEIWIGGNGGTGLAGTYNLHSPGIINANNWFVIGRSGSSGALNIDGGSIVKNATGNFTWGTGAAGNATINQTGGNITNTLSQTFMGEGGTCTWNMSAGVAQLGTTQVGYNGAAKGVFNLSGSSLLNATTLNVGAYNTAQGALILNGSSVLNATTLNVGVYNTAQGCVAQTNGTVTVSSGDNRFGGYGSVASDGGAVGIYTISGGTLSVAGNFQVGAYGSGELNVSGGTVNSASWTAAGRFPGSYGVIDVSGGNFNNTGTGNLLMIPEEGTGTLNVRGGTVTESGTSTTAAVNIGNTATAVGVVNLIGGTLNTMSVGANASASSTLNFNGGTLQARGATTTFVNGLKNAYVRAGGAVIDSQGYAVTIGQNLIPPAGSGVTSIPTNSGGSGYVTAPIVKIAGGGGTNATAIAQISGGVVTNILITSPGVNYASAPTVTLVGGKPTTAATLGTVTIGANATTGGLTKIGTGTLTLSGANTFGGAVTVSNGLINFTTMGNLGSGTAITLAGGGLQWAAGNTLDISGRTVTLNAGANVLDVGANNVTFANAIGNSGTGGFIKNGTGTLTLNVANSFSGDVNVSVGSLVIKNSGSLGAGPKNVFVNNGTAGLDQLHLDGSGGAINLPANIAFQTSNANGTGAVVNDAGDNVVNGPFTMTAGGGNTRVTVASGTLLLAGNITPNTGGRILNLGGAANGTVSGQVLDGGFVPGLLKDGTGTWTLTGVNTYTGTTSVTNGTLALSGAGSISNSPSITVSNGAYFKVSAVNGGFALNGAIGQVINGNGTVQGNVLAASGARLSPGASPGTLTIAGNLTLGGGMTNIFELNNVNTEGSGVNDEILVTGDLSLSGMNTFVITPIGTPADLINGRYILIRYSGNLTAGDASNLRGSFTTLPANLEFTLDTSVAHEVALVVTHAVTMLATPVVTNIDLTTASAGLLVVSDGHHTLTSWGTVYGLTATPTANEAVWTGAASAPLNFVSDLTGLTAGTHYYLRGWASNDVEGKTYSVDAQFYTEPVAASAVSFSLVSNRSMTISWTADPSASGSLVVVRQGAPVTGVPSDVTNYTASAQYGKGSALSDGSYVVYAAAGTSVNLWDLAKNTNVYVAVFAYAGSGSLINYQQDTPATGSQTTLNEANIEVAGEILIDVNVARGLQTNATGFVTNWVNYGTVGGSFTNDGDATTYPAYAMAGAVPGVSFDGGDHIRASFAAPKTVTGVNGSSVPEDYSVEYWVYNPALSDQEWIVCWSRRGTSPRFAGFGYGTSAAYGVAAHWAAQDMAFGEGVGTPGAASTPAAGAWHHIVVTYDGAVERAYVDGVLNAQEAKALNLWDGDPVTIGAALSSALVYESTFYSGSLSSVRVHSESLTAGQVADNYRMGPVYAPVYVVQQPQPSVIPLAAEGAAVTFSNFLAAGTTPVAYQWYRDAGTLVAGATNGNFTLANIAAADAGATFYGVASNYSGITAYTATSVVVSLTGVVTTPDTQASGVVFNNVTNRSLTISWTPGSGGNGDLGSLVLVRQAAAITNFPVDGVAYTASNQFAKGANLGGDGTYVVYVGTGSSVDVWDLSKNTTYYVAVMACSISNGVFSYLQAAPATGNQQTANGAIIEVAGQILIDLNMVRGVQANGSAGLTNWVSYGSVGGSFTNIPVFTQPTVGVIAGIPAVSFNSQGMSANFTAPKAITGVNGLGQPEDYSVEMWLYNPAIVSEEWVFGWARGETTLRTAALSYGNNATYGVVGHWAAPDMGFDGGVPSAGTWHHIVVTYDGVTEKVYVDGVLNAQEAKTLNLWDGDPVTLGVTQLNNYSYRTALMYTGWIAALRAHSGALTAGQVADNYTQGTMYGTPLYIAGNPQNQTVAEYNPATFTATAVGTQPISYQWYRNNVLVNNATNGSFTLSPALGSDNGVQFYCVASNYANATAYTATSSVATLTVLTAADALIHRYTFNGNANDSVGTAHGTLMNTALIVSNAVTMDGVNGYVDLPNDLFTNLNSVTFEAWATDLGSAGWARLWDFGTSTEGENITGTGSNYMMFTWPSGNLGSTSVRGEYRIAPGAVQIIEVGPRPSQGVKHHFVWTQDAVSQTAKLYMDGICIGTNSTLTYTPAAMGPTFNDWLGRSQFNDPYFKGTIDEFRIYNLALSAPQVADNFASGPDGMGPVAIMVQPQSLAISEINGTASFSVTAGGLPPLSYRWYRNNAPVGGNSPTLSLSGLTMADNGAEFLCVVSNYISPSAYTATSAVATLTVVPVQAGLYHRYSFAADGLDSIAGANGTLMGNAFVRGLVFDGASTFVQAPAAVASGSTRTLAAWINPQNSMAVAHIASVFDTDVPGSYGTGWGVQNGNFRAILDDMFWDTGVPAVLNQWQHVAMTFDATTANLYVNGVLRASLAYTQGAFAATAYKIGRSNANPAEGFAGGIYDAQIYDRALSDVEVAALIMGTTQTGLLARYPLTAVNGTTVEDTSGNNNTGTWTGVASFGLGGALNLFGAGQYMNLPGGIINGYTNLTVEFWATFLTNNPWARVFDFGNTNDVFGEDYVMFTPHDWWGNHQVVLRDNLGSPTIVNDNVATSAGTLDGRTVHVACVYDQANSLLSIYTNGVFDVSTPVTIPLTVVSNVYSYIGKSLFRDDAYLRASIDELRIYPVALTAEQIQLTEVLGPNRVLVDVVEFITQPQDRTLGEGASVAFSALASGYPPITYQWYRDNLPIGGATSPNYGIARLLASDSGAQFYCVASNIYNSTVYTATSRVATLTVPSTAASLVHWYPIYDGDLSDWIGGANGTPLGAAYFTNNNSIVLDGSSGTYVDLSAGMLTGLRTVTFEFWATFGANGNWARVFDFGNINGSAGEDYIMFAPHDNAANHDFAIRRNTGGLLDNYAVGAGSLDGRSVHVACVYDPTNSVMSIYTNGVLESIAAVTLPLSAVNNVYSFLGRSMFTGDAYLNAQIHEFRIYDSALSAARILQSYEMGQEKPVGDQTVTYVGDDSSLIIVQAPQATAADYLSTAVFSVRAAGDFGDPLTYQWYSPTGLVVGQTGATLTLSGVTSAQAGLYTVAVTNVVTSVGTELSATLAVLQSTLTGTVTLAAYEGTAHNGNGTRDVVFSYTDGATYTNHVTQSLNFTNGAALYSLVVPQATTRASAKTAWTLRKTVSGLVSPAPVANFVLPGGDLNGSNLVDIEDYFLLAAAWYTNDPAADIDGSGLVDLDDYFLLANSWYLPSDPE